MTVSEAQEAKPLRDENTKLKKLVVDLSLNKEMLKAVIAKNGWSSKISGRMQVGCDGTMQRASAGQDTVVLGVWYAPNGVSTLLRNDAVALLRLREEVIDQMPANKPSTGLADIPRRAATTTYGQVLIDLPRAYIVDESVGGRRTCALRNSDDGDLDVKISIQQVHIVDSAAMERGIHRKSSLRLLGVAKLNETVQRKNQQTNRSPSIHTTPHRAQGIRATSRSAVRSGAEDSGFRNGVKGKRFPQAKKMAPVCRRHSREVGW